MDYREAEKLVRADMKKAKDDSKVAIEKVLKLTRAILGRTDRKLKGAVSEDTESHLLQEYGARVMPPVHDGGLLGHLEGAANEVRARGHAEATFRIDSTYWSVYVTISFAPYAVGSGFFISYVEVGDSEVIDLCCSGTIELEVNGKGNPTRKHVEVEEPSDYSDYFVIDEVNASSASRGRLHKFSYRGRVVTAETKERAIRKIIASGPVLRP